MRLGIDIDGTLTNIVDSVIAYGQEYELENNLNEGVLNPHSDFIQTAFEWGTEIGYKFWKENVIRIHQVEPRPLTKKYLDMLHNEGHEIYIITARSDEEMKNAKKVSIKWLKKHKIPFDKIIVDAQDKGKICEENGIDAFLDDLPKNIDSVSDKGIKSFVMNSVSNELYERKGVTRIYSFVDFYREIKRMTKRSSSKTYLMNIKREFFKKIKSGVKNIELRLNDIRRHKIKEGDIINFRQDGNFKKNISVKVNAISTYKNFIELLSNEGVEACGFGKKTIEQADEIMHKYYTEEEIKKYGVVSLKIEKLDKYKFIE